jgi:hypothetical protein
MCTTFVRKDTICQKSHVLCLTSSVSLLEAIEKMKGIYGMAKQCMDGGRHRTMRAGSDDERWALAKSLNAGLPEGVCMRSMINAL